jgi:hypothetical protein
MTAPFEEADNKSRLKNFHLSHAAFVKGAGADKSMTFEEYLQIVMIE